VLRALNENWQPMFATAIYAGLRKGELIGLRKTDVDLSLRLLTVARSYNRDTTKGGHADRIPIAAELVPYLERAISASSSELVFPAPNGSMMREGVDLVGVLRRALGRAGIVTGWRHVCRRKGCGHAELAADAAPPALSDGLRQALAQAAGQAYPVSRHQALNRKPSHDGRGESSCRAAHHAAQRSEDHDGSLWPPGPRVSPRGGRPAVVRTIRGSGRTIES
jgi:integrase